MRLLRAVPRRADAAGTDHAYRADQIAQDLAQLAKITDCVRTYSIENGLDQVPALAAKVGLKVIQGIWLSSNRIKNARQIAIAVGLTKQYPGVITALVVGNEVLLRGEMTTSDLAAKSVRSGAGLHSRHLCRCLGILAAQPRDL
jgi:exo-beta-1,3-glucanase (GH17 family)